MCLLGTPRNNFAILRDDIPYELKRVASLIDTGIAFVINIIA